MKSSERGERTHSNFYGLWAHCEKTLEVNNPQSTIRNSKYSVGFTLVELIFVALALVVLLTVSLPNFHQTGQRLRAEQSTFELVQHLRYARELAVTQGRPIVWVWSPQTRRAQLEAMTEDGALEPLQDRMAQSAVLPEAITLDVLHDEVVSETVRFFPDGTSEPTTLLVRTSGGVYTVTIDAATGQVILKRQEEGE